MSETPPDETPEPNPFVAIYQSLLDAVTPDTPPAPTLTNPPETGSNTTMSKSGKIRATSANIKCNPEMPQPHVDHDVKAVLDIGGLIGWQEINIPRYWRAIEHFGGVDWNHYGLGAATECPISWRHKYWDHLDSGIVNLTGGVIHGRDTATHADDFSNPDRDAVWAGLRHRGTGLRVARVNAHYTNGGWSSGKSDRAFRQERWMKERAGTAALIGRLTAAGWLVIVGGDVNRHNSKAFGEVNYDQRTGYDYLAHVPDKRIHTLGNNNKHVGYTDHPTVWTDYRLTVS